MANRDDIPLKQLNGDKDEGQTSQSGEDQAPQETDPLWDIFRTVPEEESSSVCDGVTDKIFKALKVFTYGFLFLVLITSIIASRGSLQILTNLLGQEQRHGKDRVTQDVILYFIFFIVTIPDGIRFLNTLLRVRFTRRHLPSNSLMVIARELGHVFGLFGLLYKVAPSLNPLEFTLVTVTFPAFVGIVHVVTYYIFGKGWKKQRIMIQILNIFVSLVSLAFLIAVPFIIIQTSTVLVNKTEFIAWEISSVVLLSLRWFETYFSWSKADSTCCSNRQVQSNVEESGRAEERREEGESANDDALERARVNVEFMSTLCRIIFACIVFPTIFCNGIANINQTFLKFIRQSENMTELLYETVCSNSTTSSNFTTNCTEQIDCLNSTISNTSFTSFPCTYHIELTLWNIVGPYLVHLLSAMAVNYCAVISCRLCMQRVGFSVPLLLATPVYVGILIILKENNVDLLQDRIGLNNISGDYKVALVCFIIGWFAQLWICRHVWESDGEERLAFTRKLFVLPHFVSAFIDLSMLHSRKHKTCDPAPGREDDTPIPKVYICATMWHENRREMKQILTSIFRLDQREGRNYSNDDSYEFEAHIIFDDAMETTKQNPNEQTESKSTNLVQNNEQNSNQKTESKPTKQIRFMEPNQSQQTKSKRTINDFVRQLMEVVKVAGRLFYEKGVSLEARKYHTPYGGRLEWTLPGQNKLIAHLKDKDKIRHKKRWSQIMYMYYFAGFELLMKNKEDFRDREQSLHLGDRIFDGLPNNIKKKAMNTYVLALDGDVDFHPHSVQLLLDRMKKNPNVGAACGRIKPGGSGPLVWYQKFEYAIGHWLQKSAEHVFGCVLCSPGCFSMFRMKALMDDNVMRTYASLPAEPKHVLQYDQGEDRWLCTLLLQQGYRIEYCAAAEALTFAPEEFKEFFNQRRRWMPSTMANIWDLLASHSRTTKKNRDISYFFIIYQFILFFSSILGPSTVLLAMYTGINSVFSIPIWLGYCLVYVPVLLFIYACLKLKSNTQLNIAMVLSAIYALLMMAVLIGTLVSIASEGWYTPTGMFMYILIGTFILAGILHPHEFPNLIYGILYFICIPAGYLFLSIYAICNLNDASWGTREAQKAVLENSHKKRGKMKEAEKELGNYTSSMVDDMIKQVKDTQIANTSFFESIVSIFRWMYNLIILRSLESLQTSLNHLQTAGNFAKSMYQKSPEVQETVYESWDTSEVPGTLSFLGEEEKQFWNDLIKKYLEPLHLKKKNEEKGYDEKKEDDKKNIKALNDFKNKMAFGYFFLNALWLVIMSAMTEVKYILHVQIPQPSGPPITIEPLGFLFLVVFTILLLLQLVGMLRHRYSTFLHIISATNLGKSAYRGRTKLYNQIEGPEQPEHQPPVANQQNQYREPVIHEDEAPRAASHRDRRTGYKNDSFQDD